MHDSSPERRNLIITSLAFIVFFVAGGEVSDDIVRIQFVNIRFTDPQILAIFAWVFLIWFAYRYWLTHKGLFSIALDKELRFYSSRSYVRAHVARVINNPVVPDSEKGVHINSIYLVNGELVANLQYAKEIKRDKGTFEVNSWDGTQERDIPSQVSFTGLRSLIVKLRLYTECFLAKPSFSSYIVPYVLFLAAVLTGIDNEL